MPSWPPRGSLGGISPRWDPIEGAPQPPWLPYLKAAAAKKEVHSLPGAGKRRQLSREVGRDLGRGASLRCVASAGRAEGTVESENQSR